MATELDLDLDNYNIKDIEKFFRFKQNSLYTASDVEFRENEIREQLLNSGHINKRLKRDLINFLTLAKQWLINVKCPNTKPAPTKIPKNYRLDTVDLPRSKDAMSREEELNSKPPTQFVYTNNGEYYPGIINPLDKRIITKNICIDTIFRQNYSSTKSTDFVFSMPKKIKNVSSMQITSFEFPHIWFSFSSEHKNNEMTIYLYNMPDYPDKVHNIIIPDGNYTKESFKIMMNNYFSKEKGGLEFLYVDIDPVTTSTVFRVNTLFYNDSDKFVFDNDSDEIVFDICDNDFKNNHFHFPPPTTTIEEIATVVVSDNNFDNFKYYKEYNTKYERYDPTKFYFVLDFTITSDANRPLYKNLGWMLGFRKKWYTVNYDKTYLSYTMSNIRTILYRGYCKSESYYGCSIDNYFFVEIDDFHNNFPTDTIMSVSDTNSNYLGKNIIARITITSGINTIVTDNASDQIFKKREYFGPVNIDKFRIRLLNRFGDVINLNNNDYSFTLELKQIYS